MDKDKNGGGTDYTGEMKWNMPMQESTYNTDLHIEGVKAEKSVVSLHKSALLKMESSVEGNLLGYVSDNKSQLDISSMSTQNAIAANTFSRGQDVITNIEKKSGVTVENVERMIIVLVLKTKPVDLKQKLNDAMQTGQLQHKLKQLQNLFETEHAYPKRICSKDTFSERELRASCLGITPVDESDKESMSSSVQQSENKNVEKDIRAAQADLIQKEMYLSNDATDKRISDMQKNILAAEPNTDFAKELFSSDLQLNKETQKILLDTVSKKLSEKYKQSIISTWPGTETTSGETVLVCLHSGSLHPEFSSFLGFGVRYREFDRIERESVIAQTSTESRKAKLSEEDTTLINNAIREYGDELFCKHSNLEAISSSGILSSDHGRKLSPKICIVLYCRVKGIIPFGENPFPRSLNIGDQTIDVDIREGYFYLYAFKPDPRRSLPQRGDDVNQVLRMGCSIGRVDCPLKGTLGPFVRIDNDSIGFLTCAHVLGDLASNTDVSQLKNLEVVQPSNIDHISTKHNQTDRVCGVIQEIQFSEDWKDPVSKEKCGAVDAALVRITNRAPSREEFAWIDQSQLSNAGFGTAPPVYEDGAFKVPLNFADMGMRIIKCGAATGLRRGTLSTTVCWARVHESDTSFLSLMKEEAKLTLPSLKSDDVEKSIIMKDLIHVDPVREVFFEPGDSGAGVFMVDGTNYLTCIGLAIGCLSDHRCVMTPIDRVLKALGLGQESLKAFSEELMETDA